MSRIVYFIIFAITLCGCAGVQKTDSGREKVQQIARESSERFNKRLYSYKIDKKPENAIWKFSCSRPNSMHDTCEIYSYGRAVNVEGELVGDSIHKLGIRKILNLGIYRSSYGGPYLDKSYGGTAIAEDGSRFDLENSRDVERLLNYMEKNTGYLDVHSLPFFYGPMEYRVLIPDDKSVIRSLISK